MTQVFSEEISRARNEHLANARGPLAKKGSKKKTIARVAVEFFETVWDGTRLRRKGEIQYCCICGAVTVFKGWKTGHKGSHPAGSKGDYI